MTKSYQIVSPPGSSPTLDPQRIAELLAKDGQLILPLLELLENAQCALDDLIDVMGRATIEAVLRMSAETIAGPKPQGQKSDRDIVYHGTQQGRVTYSFGGIRPAARPSRPLDRGGLTWLTRPGRGPITPFPPALAPSATAARADEIIARLDAPAGPRRASRRVGGPRSFSSTTVQRGASDAGRRSRRRQLRDSGSVPWPSPGGGLDGDVANSRPPRPHRDGR
jgi:hypothetical protein